jgi:hypothetical protein
VPHRTVRCPTGLSGVPAERPANDRPRDQRATRGLRQRSPGHIGLFGASPDCPVCHEDGGCNGRFHQTRKEITHCSLSGGAPDCPVQPRTEGNQSLPIGTQTTRGYLGAIIETPRRMEHNTKHPLNILQCLDFASTHSFHCDRDLSTSLSCNSAALCHVLVS